MHHLVFELLEKSMVSDGSILTDEDEGLLESYPKIIEKIMLVN